MTQRTVDVVILGAGPVGEVAAGRLADAGLEVALVERELVGGECSYWACMPSKALLRPAQARDEARRIPGAAQAVTGELDVDAVLARRDEVIHDLDDSGQLPWLEERGIALVRGVGAIAGERAVSVGDETLLARRAVVIATGTLATIPPIDGLADAQPWTSREATTAKAIPQRLIVLGGGVVGVEMAEAYAGFGAKVTLLEGGPRLIAREEPFASEQLAAALRARGVDVRVDAKVEGVHRDGTTVIVTTEGGAHVEAEEILVAVGRTPRTSDIGLETVGLAVGKSIPTDIHLCVEGHPWLYAVGDVNGRALLTHQGKYQARIAADHILGRPNASLVFGGPLSPRVIFTEPQVAAVGYTLHDAQKAGLDVRCVDVAIDANAGASFYGRGVEGTARLVVDENRRVIIGATFTGADVAEFVHAATLAIVADVPLDRRRHAVPSFPTRSEVWLKLMEAYGL